MYNVADGIADDSDFGLSYTVARFIWATILVVIGIGFWWAIDLFWGWAKSL